MTGQTRNNKRTVVYLLISVIILQNARTDRTKGIQKKKNRYYVHFTHYQRFTDEKLYGQSRISVQYNRITLL